MQHKIIHTLWDLWCVVSVVGIWPRYIEPRLLHHTSLTLKVPELPKSLDGIKIFQISDLHFGKNSHPKQLAKAVKQARLFAPDLILFCGDFISESTIWEKEQLLTFLKQFSAPYGCFAVLGNHDYASMVGINAAGDYVPSRNPQPALIKGLKRLFKNNNPTGKFSPEIAKIPLHRELMELLSESPFRLLHNETVTIPIKDTCLNICGLGEYMLNKTDPAAAFANYNKAYPGVILLHNPDALPLLHNYPGEVVLCGHTHGAQVNLPVIRDAFLASEQKQFISGLYDYDKKSVYINRGLGATFTFRWFSIPETLQLTLRG